jgi:hypothetical protein
MIRRTKIRVRRCKKEVEIDTADLDKADEIVRRLARELGDGKWSGFHGRSSLAQF